MIKYIALLRGINVGGKNLIKMDELSRLFSSWGFRNVRTFIQCGNVIFDVEDSNADKLARRIERKLHQSLGYEVPVLLTTLSDLQKLLKRSPFTKIKPDPDLMMIVAFLFAAPARKPRLPLVSLKDKIEVLAIEKRAVFVLCHRKQTGWFGFPNNFVEKELAVTATSRQLTTVNKIIAFAEAM